MQGWPGGEGASGATIGAREEGSAGGEAAIVPFDQTQGALSGSGDRGGCWSRAGAGGDGVVSYR